MRILTIVLAVVVLALGCTQEGAKDIPLDAETPVAVDDPVTDRRELERLIERFAGEVGLAWFLESTAKWEWMRYDYCDDFSSFMPATVYVDGPYGARTSVYVTDGEPEQICKVFRDRFE